MKYGTVNERITARKYEEETGRKIKNCGCGLFIDVANFFLCTSPDGLIRDDGLIEIKCPCSARNASTLIMFHKIITSV